MNRRKLFGSVAVVALLTLVAIPVGLFIMGARLYGEAEPVADLLHSIHSRAPDMSRERVRAVVTNEEFRLLHSYPIDYPADTNVVLWVHINRRFTVGLGRNGGVLWQVNK